METWNTNTPLTGTGRSPHLDPQPLDGSLLIHLSCQIWLLGTSKIFCRCVFGTILLGPLELTFCKCSIPVFEGLLPNDHNKIVVDLLFIMAHWHGLAKLRMHSDLTLEILDQQTTKLGEQLRQFKANVCTVYNTQELNRKVDARSRRQVKEAAKRAEKGGSQQNAAA